MRSDCKIFFLIAIVASVLNSDVLNSDGNKYIAWLIELMSALVISARIFFDIGLPLRYRIASTLVTSSISGNFLVIRSA